MSAVRLWQAHGLVVGCDDVELDVRPLTVGHPTPDLTFRVLAPGPVPDYGQTLPGRVLAHYDDHQGSALSVAERDRAGDRFVDVCFHGVALASIETRSGETTLVLDPEADPGLASVLISGTLLSVALMLRGHPVLHASAAVVPGGPAESGHSAIAFVGQSGMGKSTMATLLCRDGGTLLTDDVLRTELAGDGSVLAWPGATALRLRPGARELGVAAAGEVSVTADERFSASPTLAADETVPLTALIIPQPDRESEALTTTRLDGVRAVLALASFPRILGWTDPVTTGQALRHWGELVRRVPVLVMQIPWGPPFAADLGEQVVAAALDAAGHSARDTA